MRFPEQLSLSAHCSREDIDPLAPYLKAARWSQRGIDPFIDMRLVFRAGLQADLRAALAEEGVEWDPYDSDPAVESMYVSA